MDFKSDKNLINSDFCPLLNYQEQQAKLKELRKSDIKNLKRGAYNLVIIGLAVYVCYKLVQGLVMRGVI